MRSPSKQPSSRPLVTLVHGGKEYSLPQPRPAVVSFVAGILILALAVQLSPFAPEIALGAYSASTQDVDGNYHLGNSSVNDTVYYDRSQDSDETTQRQLGIDPNWATGVTRKSYALKFDGSNDYASATLDLSTTNVVTVEFWLNWATYANDDDLALEFSSNYNNVTTGFIVNPNASGNGGGSASLSLKGDTGLNTRYFTRPTEDEWHHWALVFDKSQSGTNEVTAYIDGVAQSMTQTFANDNTNNFGNTTLYFMSRAGASLFGEGIMDEVRISHYARYTTTFTPLRRLQEDSNTVALWHFDEGEATTANDSSRSNAAVTLASSTATPTWVTGGNAIMDGFNSENSTGNGVSGAGNITLGTASSDASDKAYELRITGSNALSFDGTDNYATLGTDTSLNFADNEAFTIETWVKTTDTTGPIISFRNSSDANPVIDIVIGYDAITTDNGKPMVLVRESAQTNNYAAIAGTTSINDGLWHHIALTRNTTGTLTLYVDGNSVAATTSTNVDGAITTNLRALGSERRWEQDSYSSAGNRYLDGALDEVRISKHERYTSSFTPSRRFATDSTTYGLWHLDEGTGTTTVADSSGAGNTATLGSSGSGSDTNDPAWVEGIAAAPTQPGSTGWALPGYSHRKRINVATSSALNAGHSIETTENRATILDNKQTRSDAKDWRVMYQPTDATRSLNFDSNDLVAVPDSSNLDPGTGDFTIEAWVKGGSMADSDIIVGKSNGGAASSTYGYLFGVFDSLKPTLYFATGANSYTKIQGATSLTNGQWYHLAIVVDRDSTTNTKVFVNGIDDSATISGVALTTNNGSISNSVQLAIGNESDGGFEWDGKIDEVRVSSSVRYGANFTPSRTNTPSDANTMGLWHLDEGDGVVVRDASHYESHGTLGNDPSDDADSDEPSWSTDGAVSTTQEVPRFIPEGHSLLLDGSGDYARHSASVLSSGPFTIEGWFKSTNTPSGTDELIALGPTTGSNIFIRLSGTTLQASVNGTGSVFSGSTTISGDTWYHVALTYDANRSNKAQLYLNGNYEGASTATAAFSVANVTIGGSSNTTPSNTFTGQLDEIRISDTVRYTNEFTAATTPFANDSNTRLLWHLDEGSSTSLTDQSGNSYTGTVTNATWLTNGGKVSSANQTRFRAVGPVGSSSTSKEYFLYYGNPNEGGTPVTYQAYGLTFDGTNDYVNVGSVGSATGAKTLTFWMNTSNNNSEARIVTNTNNTNFATRIAAGNFQVWGRSNPWRSVVTGISAGTWYHIALVFDGSGNVTGYKNGSVGTTEIVSEQWGTLAFGHNGAGSWYLGSLDDIRVYNEALSAASIADIYAGGSGDSNSFDNWWKFDEGSGTSAADSRGSATGTLTSFDNRATSRWLTNSTPKVTTEPTQTILVTEQESPVFYQWRDVAYPSGSLSQGSWSTRAQIPTSETQLGVSGVFVRFQPTGVYSLHDYYRIASWATEAFSTSVPRGKLNSFPLNANIIATAASLDIIDATTNTLWMRIPAESGGIIGSNAPEQVNAKNGRIYIAGNDGLSEIQLDLDDAHRWSSAGNNTYSVNLADRDDGYGYSTISSGNSLVATSLNDVSAAVTNSKQTIAVATDDGISVIKDTTRYDANNLAPSGITVNDYAQTAGDNYNDIVLTSGGEVYASNATDSTLDVYQNVHGDSSDQTSSADVTYSTSSTPALRNGTINDISIAESTSTAESGQNTLIIGHNSGMDVVQEHSTQTSGTVRYYLRTGTTGTSNWSPKQFSGAAKFDGSNDQIVAASTYSLGTASITLECWVYLDSTSLNGAFIKVGNANTGYGIGVGSTTFGNTGNNLIGLYEQRRWINTGVPIGTGWHHVALVIDASSYPTFYLDGTAVYSDTTPTTIIAPTTSTYIGGYDASGAGGETRFTASMIDEVRISSSIRYASNFTPTSTPFTSDGTTAALFHLNEQSGQAVTNATGGTNATLGASGTVSTDDPLFVAPSIAGSSDKVVSVTAHKTPSNSADYAWVGTNGAGSNDGALAAISLTTDKQHLTFTTTTSGLPDLDTTSLSLGSGGLALVGTEAGAWNPGSAGIVVTDQAAAPVTAPAPVRIKSGGTRIKNGVRIKRSE